MSRTSTGDKALDVIKFKCKVDRDTIEMLARSVGYKEWTTYLMNEEVWFELFDICNYIQQSHYFAHTFHSAKVSNFPSLL